MLANQGDANKAAKYFKYALKLDPNSVAASFGLGKSLHQITKNSSAALPHYEKCVALDSKHYKAYCQLGKIYLEKMELDKSAEYLKKCLSINPKHVLGLVAMGNLLFETGHSNHAEKYHRQALKYNEKDVEANIGLGNALYDLERAREAI
jgi:tetratricopeptide (TPR) repeat protein